MTVAARPGMTQVVAVTGEAATDGNGVYESFLSAQLNDTGAVVFAASLSDTNANANDDSGLFRWINGQTSIVQREGNPLPNQGGEFVSLSNTNLNNANQVTYFNNALNTTRPSVTGFFQEDGISTTLLVADQQLTPDGNGTYESFNTLGAYNSAGDFVFRSVIRTNPVGPANDSGITFSDPNGLFLVAREGQTIPGTSAATYNGFDDPALSESGDIAFFANLSGTVGGSTDDAAIFGGSPENLQLLVQKGETAPDNLGMLTGLSGLGLNNTGTHSFFGTLSGTASRAGIFAYESGTLKTIAADAQAFPDGDGSLSISPFGSVPRVFLNDLGQVYFSATRTGTLNAANDGFGLFRGDGQQLTTIARFGQANPDGDGTLGTFFGTGGFNDLGQAAFIARINGVDPSVDFALFHYDDTLGLQVVAREGDPFLGSTLSQIQLADEHTNRDREMTGLNNIGEAAFRFTLADGREGVALWSPIPEPSTCMLALAAFCVAMRRKRF